ncbi:hypothetical protein H0H92_001116 [Tricholoma furcatifolium]|nr:hypothetical protein H0H92_001116 [Tricholoma furcatifolium]
MAALPPEYVYGSVLPHKTLNVLDLLKFVTPLINEDTSILNHDIFSKSPNSKDPSSTFKALPPMREKDDLIDDEEDAWLDEPLEPLESAATLTAMASFVNMNSLSLKSVFAPRLASKMSKSDSNPKGSESKKVDSIEGKDHQ